MDTYIKEEHYPKPSLVLRPITDHEVHPFKCECLMCNKFIVEKQGQILRKQEQKMLSEKSLQKRKENNQSLLKTIIKGLVIPTNKIIKRGVEVFTPEVCFYQDGEPTSFYYTKDPEDYHLIKMKKEKISHTIMQKILNQHRRSYRDRLRNRLRLPRDASIRKGKNQKKVGTVPRIENLHAVVIRYTDGCESLLTENQLINILQKRKTDPFWKKVSSIKNFVGPLSSNQSDSEYVVIHFDINKPAYQALWERAQRLIKNYSTKIMELDQQYISDQQEALFCSDLRLQSRKIFAIYSFYKIAAFLTQFSDQQITKAEVKMFVNELGQCFLLEVKQLSMNQLVKFNFTSEICNQMIQNQQYNKYHKKKLNSSPRIKVMSNKIEQMMNEQYEQMKERYGVSVKPKVDQNQQLNNQFFKHLYPNLPGDISELIKEEIPFNTFRKKYLGQEQKRRTLFQPFNSKFVRQLHQLTPVKVKNRSISSRSGFKSTMHSTIPAQTARNSTIEWRRRDTPNKMSQTIAV